MAISDHIKDRQRNSFEECPLGSGLPARRVKVVNEEVPVTEIGDISNIYGESLSVAGFATSTIVTYVVPVGKKLELKRADFSGENIAVYTLEVGASVQSTKRTYYTVFDGAFEMEGLTLAAGVTVLVKVENKRNSTADFNSNIIGRLKDA